MQINLNGTPIDDIAIDRIRTFEPPEGYYLAFSGGKDSICIYDLVLRAGVKFDAHYQVTGIDPPELAHFIRLNYPEVKWEMPEMSIWRWIEKKGLPTRQNRWCCEKLKERGGQGRRVLTGVRWAESVRRSKRQMTEHCFKDGRKTYLHPIIDWKDVDVWQYIEERSLKYCSLYDEGFKRLGCIMCPMAGTQLSEGDRWPKIREAWHRAAIRYYDGYGVLNHKKAESKPCRFSSGEQFWQWWLSGESVDNYIESQNVAFE